MPMLLLAIALGGAAGAVARYVCASWIHARAGSRFPWGTLAVNLSGSFLLGLLLPLLVADAVPAPLRAFVTVGLLGSFTTFSTFAWETVSLLAEQQLMRGAAYVFSSLVLGLLSIAAGFTLGRMLV